MSKIRFQYSFKGIEEWQANDRLLKELIKQDTSQEFWPETMSMPPMGIAPPVTKDCLDKIKKLDGVVVVNEQEED